jgi:hypothetical protein
VTIISEPVEIDWHAGFLFFGKVFPRCWKSFSTPKCLPPSPRAGKPLCIEVKE